MSAVIEDYRTAPIPEPERVLLDWVVKLTVKPSDCTESDIDGLRALGWSDEDISAAGFTASYFNFINRIAEGLGVDPDPYMEDCPPLGPCPWVD